ncbi:Oidioi.mRNA.OKI2018_I69.XSR.g15937.t1.cds [Oikopleura dioica]|uniref:Oidioi.mRNA.OKI2018_I69.XSR.g15937.t1.cds n=1 Tax=Oikopleura dioica TaxID=34765 RepID=A0ABN7SKU1_OIKDI|nr:Oidioi.mRNA.OKI2018_I69.XSR.g15937.t1.cds [Oikopleura dioica]
MRDGGKCKRHEDEVESFLFRPRTKEENEALARYGSTPIALDMTKTSVFENYTDAFEILRPDGSWIVKEEMEVYRALPTCVYKSDLCPNFFHDKRTKAIKKKILIREITPGKRQGRYRVKKRYMKSLLFDFTKHYPLTSNIETKERSGFLEGTVFRIQCKKWQEKKPMSIRCTRIGDDPHLRFVKCKSNIFIHLHDQQTISDLRLSLQKFNQLAEDSPNSAAQRISDFSNEKIHQVIDFFNADTTEETVEDNDEYEAPMELVASPSETEFLETRQCESEKNVFF